MSTAYVYYQIKYGYELQPNDDPRLEWWATVNFPETKGAEAQYEFNQYTKYCPSIGEPRPNVLYLLLIHTTENTIEELDKHKYLGHEPLEDRPHIELDTRKARGLAPIPDGAWVAYARRKETGETRVLGLSRTPGGATTLVNREISTLDLSQVVYIEYQEFIETHKEGKE